MISKKLLSEVLSDEVECIREELMQESKYVFYDTKDSQFVLDINIHELAHKCKEWASKYTIYSGKKKGQWLAYIRELDSPSTFYAPTEPEAIFKACEWILNQKDEK